MAPAVEPEQIRLLDLGMDGPESRPNFKYIALKMILEGWRVRLASKKNLMSLYKAFERLKRAGKSEGMWTRKVDVAEWFVQARKLGERANPLRHIARRYVKPGYNYGLWKSLAERLDADGHVRVTGETAAKRVVAALRHYYPDKAYTPEYAPLAPLENDEWQVWIPHTEGVHDMGIHETDAPTDTTVPAPAAPDAGQAPSTPASPSQ